MSVDGSLHQADCVICLTYGSLGIDLWRPDQLGRLTLAWGDLRHRIDLSRLKPGRAEPSKGGFRLTRRSWLDSIRTYELEERCLFARQQLWERGGQSLR
jgi:hypothetical protein